LEIRDLLHGTVTIEPGERPVLDSRYFQRLRGIKQMGFSEFSFPSATHSRFSHSVGALATVTRAWDVLERRTSGLIPRRFRRLLRLAALLHDIGHGPLSHSTEFAMPEVGALKLPHGLGKEPKRRATHEDYTLKILLDSSLTALLDSAGTPDGFSALHVAALIEPNVETGDDFFLEHFHGQRLNFRPLLEQLISSELDADRMDYLRRDSLHAGVSYGQFDFDWIVQNLTLSTDRGRVYLALEHRALYAFEDFLLSRLHMFLMVYFHYKSVIYEEMLKAYMQGPRCTYRIPADIERYLGCDDAELAAHLTKSKDPWARRIAEHQPLRRVIEIHSGIPATTTAHQEQERLLNRTENALRAQKIAYLRSTSHGVLSKYFGRARHPLFVRYDNLASPASFIPLEKCTDLFRKSSEPRVITRIYADEKDLERFRPIKNLPLRFEDPETRLDF
jgi:HD superfamily phosphohydrolase